MGIAVFGVLSQDAEVELVGPPIAVRRAAATDVMKRTLAFGHDGFLCLSAHNVQRFA
jgi:hypothetical protein